MNIEEIFHEERLRQRRLDDTYMAVMALPSPERIQLVVRVADATEGVRPVKTREKRRQPRAGGTTGRASIKNAIAEVLAVGAPLGARAITDRIQSIRPGTSLASVHGELIRMRGEHVVVQVGIGPRNGGLYALNGGQTTGTT